MNEQNVARYAAMRAITLISAVVCLSAALNLDSPAAGEVARPGETCRTPADQDWPAPEQWAWIEICEGRAADFNRAAGLREPLDPAGSEGWDVTREIRPEFIETILLHPDFTDAIPRHGLQIIGAWIREPLDLASSRLDAVIRLERSRLESGANLSGAKLGSRLSFDQSVFGDAVNLRGIRIEGELSLRNAQMAGLILDSARISGPVDLSGTTVSGSASLMGLWADDDVFGRCGAEFGGAEFGRLDLHGAVINGNLELYEASVYGLLNLGDVEIRDNLLMFDDPDFHCYDNEGEPLGKGFSALQGFRPVIDEISLSGAEIAGRVNMNGLHVNQTLDMDSIIVGGSIFLRCGARIGQVILTAGTIGHQLEFTGSIVRDNLGMHGLRLGSNLYINDGSEEFCGTIEDGGTEGDAQDQVEPWPANLGSLSLTSAQIGGDIDAHGAEFASIVLDGTTIDGRLLLSSTDVEDVLSMEDIRVGRNLSLAGAKLNGEVSLLFSAVGADLDLSGADLSQVNLTASRLGELRLGSAYQPSAQWRPDGLLVLQNVEAGAIQDRRYPTDAWPSQLELDGFTYQRLGGYSRPVALDVQGETGASMADRDAEWFVEWLDNDPTFSPQPYRQLAGLLQSNGQKLKADQVLYAGLERERRESSFWPKVGFTMLKVTVGYGIGFRYFISVIWIVGFVVFGFIVLMASKGPEDKKPWHWLAACSLDMLLPIVKLDADHSAYVQKLVGWTRSYFYLHQLAGWVLASFLIAALGGVTKL